jgi:DNA-damage-inducible protein J
MLCRKDVIALASKSITVRVDEAVKAQAEAILDDIGINVTTLFNSCLKALVRERRVPFSMEDGSRARLVREKLEESLTVAADPNAPRYTHEEIFTPLRKKYNYDV